MHGSAARAARAKAEHLAAVAKGLELKLSVTMLSAVAREGEKGDLEAAVEGYGAWLKREREELEHRKVVAEVRLREFEEVGGAGAGAGAAAKRGGVMREIARRYAEVEEEIARVEAELGRLEVR